ncbi:dihydropyrimidinase-related protein 1-like [Crotalus adamanteus]|uniref:Dihydropyrimidinase-related protein 1-like n=1 Tax=Crotalus adamanteus TaxID=8729 RepID=A0AAW1BBX5_CROAD
MAGRQRPGGRSGEEAEDELPVYLARPGTAAQTPRQKYGGMFAAVEGAFENKTLDFQAYSVGQKGARTPRSGSRSDLLDRAGEAGGDCSEVSGSGFSSPAGEANDRRPALCLELRPPLADQPWPGPEEGKVKPGGGECGSDGLGAGPGEGAWGLGAAPGEGLGTAGVILGGFGAGQMAISLVFAGRLGGGSGGTSVLLPRASALVHA